MLLRKMNTNVGKILFFAIALACCGLDFSPTPLTAEARKRIDAALQLLAESTPESTKRQENITLLSPCCLEMNLSLLYYGSAGETRQQLATLLRADSPEQFLRDSSDLLSRFRESGGVVQCDNAMRYDTPNFLYIWKKSFVDDIQRNNFCTMEAADLSAYNAKSLPCVFELASRLRFSGEWQYPFEPENEDVAFYHAPDTPPILTPMMVMNPAWLNYYEDENWTSLALPFRNQDYQLLLFRPHQIIPHRELSQMLSAETVISHLEQASSGLFRVKLPKFSIHNRVNAFELMQRLEVKLGFGADFSSMISVLDPFTDGVCVSSITQDNTFEINEKRAEGYSQTITRGIPFSCSASGSMPNRNFVADRPFLFLLRHCPSGAILFIGSYECPETRQTK